MNCNYPDCQGSPPYPPQSVLSVTELQQLLSYVEHRDNGNDGGWYFGSKKLFERRHFRIRAVLEAEITRRGSDGGSKEE